MVAPTDPHTHTEGCGNAAGNTGVRDYGAGGIVNHNADHVCTNCLLPIHTPANTRTPLACAHRA